MTLGPEVLHHHHPTLGAIRGIRVTPRLTQFRALPYATIPRRFARSSLRRSLPSSPSPSSLPFDATCPGPSCVQPFGSAKKDAAGMQLPVDQIEEGEGDYQSENECLHLTITVSTEEVRMIGEGTQGKRRLPVLLFLHGGAYFMGAGSRSYYSPLTLCTQAIDTGTPILFIAANYRLGPLGFFHSSLAPDLMPPNNGVHDQLRLFEWIKENIEGFGGDRSNITAMGQSAGAESLSLHNMLAGVHAHDPPYNRSIVLSGSPVTMPSKNPDEHQQNFIDHAKKLGIAVPLGAEKDVAASKRIAEEMIDVDIGKIRDLNYVGNPCALSEMMPYDQPTMALTRGDVDTFRNEVGRPKLGYWPEQQIVSGTGFDGVISYTMLSGQKDRKDHAKAFIKISYDVLASQPRIVDALLDLYEIATDVDDDTALKRIVQFTSDIGFYMPALAEAQGGSRSRKTRTYLQVVDLGNPFDGPLEKEKYATHAWDIVALLGAFEDRLSEEYKRILNHWRAQILTFVSGRKDDEPWTEFIEDGNRSALVVDRKTAVVAYEGYMGAKTRRGRLDAIAREVDEVRGWDTLWIDLCRRFLMAGE